MDPFDFGTGFQAPQTFGLGNATPVVPQIDLAAIAAQHLASQGIRPGQFLQNPAMFGQMPGGGAGAFPSPQPPAASVWDPTPVTNPGGAPLPTPAAGSAPAAPGAPLDITSDSQKGTEASAQGTSADKKGKEPDKLLDTLRGLKAPAPPTPQTIRSPAAPDARGSIKTGELIALLTALQAGGGQPNPLQGLSLGALLGGKG